MHRYIQKRLLEAIPALLGVSILAFLIIHLVPGDPVAMMFSESGASGELLEQKREALGLNDPLPVQYGRFLWGALHGDLGRSIISRRPVLQSILEQFPATLQLTFASMAIAMVLGTLFGIVAAIRVNTFIDTSVTVVSLLGVSVPAFWSGLLMILLFSLRLGWLPATGSDSLKHLIMPAALLGFIHAGIVARIMRSSMLEVLGQDYIVTARAKGISERGVILGHALKNALIPTVTVAGLQFGALLNGAFIIEAVFARQGIGNLAIWAIVEKDFTTVQGIVLFSATVYLMINIIVDASYAYLDPRIRYR